MKPSEPKPLTRKTHEAAHSGTGQAAWHPRGCRAYRSAALNHTNNANFQTFNFDTEEFNDRNMFDVSTDTFTVPPGMGGRWRLAARLSFSGNATGRRIARLNKNGGTIIDYGEYSGADGANVVPSPFCYFYGNLEVGDTVVVQGYQSSGGNLAYNPGIDSCWFTAEYLGHA